MAAPGPRTCLAVAPEPSRGVGSRRSALSRRLVGNRRRPGQRTLEHARHGTDTVRHVGVPVMDRCTPSGSGPRAAEGRNGLGPVPLPPANDLYGVNGSGPTNVYAVGDTGSILHYDGTRWATLASPQPVLLRSVWTANADLTYIVGAEGTMLTASGETITALPSPTTRFLRSVWGIAPNDVYAVGDTGTIIHFDGSRWTTMTSGSSALLRAVWGSSSTDVYRGRRGRDCASLRRGAMVSAAEPDDEGAARGVGYEPHGRLCGG